jgi:hypothetical protein
MSGSSKEKEALHMLGIESGFSDLVSVQCSADECYGVSFGLHRTGPFSDCHVLMCFHNLVEARNILFRFVNFPSL